MSRKKRNNTQEEMETSLLDVVSAEFTGVTTPSTRDGRLSSVALQDITWRPRAALFVAQRGMQILEDIIESKDAKNSDRIRALELMMAYTYGKPTQKVEHTGANGGPIQTMATRLADLSLDDLKAILEFSPKIEEDDSYNPADNLWASEAIDVEIVEDFEGDDYE